MRAKQKIAENRLKCSKAEHALRISLLKTTIKIRAWIEAAKLESTATGKECIGGMMPELSEIHWLPSAYDTLAPDGSEIRLLGTVAGGSMVHCTLPVGGVTRAVAHRTVEEIWYILSGRGQVWRRAGEADVVVDVGRGASLTIRLGVTFQFRTVGDEPLQFVIVTMPPWPGEDEAVPAQGLWEPR